MAKKGFDFTASVSSILFALGARPPAAGERLPFDYKVALQTRAGRLSLVVHDDWIAGLFDDARNAKKVVKNNALNTRSGKWNFSFLKPDMECVNEVVRNIAEVMIDDDDLEAMGFLDGQGPNTAIEYGYVDGSNYKSNSTVVLQGRLSANDAKVILALANTNRAGRYEFVPGQVGLADLQGQDASMWIEGTDHAMHGVYGMGSTAAEPGHDVPSATELVEQFVKVACEGGWDEDHKPASYQEMRANALAQASERQ